MGAPRRRGGEWAKPPEIRGFPPCLRRTRGRTARAGFPCAQARTGGKSMPVRQGFGRRRAGGRQPRGRGRKIGQRARGGGRTKLVSARGRARKISQRAGQDGAGGLPPRAGPDRWEKYTGTAGFWPRGGGGQPRGAGAQNRSARAGRGADKISQRAGGGGAKSVSVRGAGGAGGLPPARRPGPVEKVCRYGRVLAAGRARKIGQRARGGGRTWSGGSIIVQAGGIPAAGRGVDSRGARGGQN